MPSALVGVSSGPHAHEAAGRGMPTPTVTLLFSDIEGSTRLLERLGVDCSNVLA
jgi:class 3 adenylate cyclase